MSDRKASTDAEAKGRKVKQPRPSYTYRGNRRRLEKMAKRLKAQEKRKNDLSKV